MSQKLKKINAKLVSIRFIYIALGIGIGLLVMAQLRTIPDRITNPATPVLSLAETRDLLYKEQSSLSDEAAQLQSQNAVLQNEIRNKSVSKDELAQLESQKAMAGMTAISGPGVKIVMDDSNSGSSEEAIVHAADLRDVVNLLWSGGAEGISINDQRVVFTTAIDCIVNTVLINNNKISTPFVITAIGDRDRMQNALSSPLNLADIKNRAKYSNLVFEPAFQDKLNIPAFKGSFILSTDIQ